MYIFLILPKNNNMEVKMANQNIKCDVTNCKFNNSDTNECNLEEIDVSCTCDKCNCNTKKETICNSFKEKE